ncbi:MAG TPA: hypothetical protein VF228_24515, partial [Iamia sp.]
AAPITAAAPAGADEPEGDYCVAYALTAAEIEAGAFTEVECYATPEEIPQGRSADIDLAIIYDGTGGGSPSTVLRAASCTGAKFAFSSTDWWNDKISSTDLVSCGSAKHYVSATYTGTHELVTTSAVFNFTTVNNLISSIEYAP